MRTPNRTTDAPFARTLMYGLAGLILGALWIFLSAVPNGAALDRVAAPQRGFPAPDFRLPDASGEEIALSELRGRPVLINLWASWCAPCRAEMPAIQNAYEAYQDRGFVVLAVNMTAQDSEAAALAFTSEHQLSFPILFDHDGEVARLYQNRALPSSYFVDSTGIIREVVIGGPMAEALLLTRIEGLFALEMP